MENNLHTSSPFGLDLAGNKLSGLLVTAFEGQEVHILCLENQTEFLVPLGQASLISPLTREWMEDYCPCSVPYPIQLREDGGFYDRESPSR